MPSTHNLFFKRKKETTKTKEKGTVPQKLLRTMQKRPGFRTAYSYMHCANSVSNTAIYGIHEHHITTYTSM